MPNLDDLITGFVAGDDLSVRRTLTGIDVADVLNQAWMTIRDSEDDTSVAAVLTKGPITTANVVGTGQIENNGSVDGTGVVRFDLVPADTRLIGTVGYFFDIQVRTATGTLTYTPVKGVIRAVGEVSSA